MKTTRHISIADHLWETFERMARDMGSDRDALVNQAMHMFARLNGFAVPGASVASSPPDLDAARARAPDTEPEPPPPLPRGAAAEAVLEAAARLEQSILEPVTDPGQAIGGLLIVREDGTPLEVSSERFVIGRGKHCDLVIDSPKVSREHAAIVRDGDGWIIEDLGSSNGTWCQRERITRKKVADGDEYFVCAEKIRCVLR